MGETVFIRDCDPKAVEQLIRKTLEEVQTGKYSEELKATGVSAPSNLVEGLKISESGQGMSPNEWMEIITIFGPTVATVAKDIWTIIIVPKLKKAFREDSISTKDPNSNT